MNSPYCIPLLVALSTLVLTPAARAQPAGGGAEHCRVTQMSGGHYGNEFLEAVLPRGSTFVFEPGGPGFVEADGALGIKFAWERRTQGALHVSGRRLDGTSAIARAYIPDGYGDIGFQPVYMVFPAPGCWEITGKVAGHELTMVVFVQKVGNGPSWKRTGPSPGWRVTT